MRPPAKALKENDCDLALIRSKRVGVVGYGNQGRAHALNLRDFGVETVVAARPGSPGWRRAQEDGFAPMQAEDAAPLCEAVLLAVPDEKQKAVWDSALAPALRPGAALVFAHGFAIHFGAIAPPPHFDVVLVAPLGPGTALRAEFEAGRGLPALTAVAQDASGAARALALSYACGIGAGRAGILETSFKDECETDLFGEQTVLCGGLTQLVRAGYDTLVEAGYSPEMAYFECAHQVKLLADLMFQRGIAGMFEAISNTAEFGAHRAGPLVVGEASREAMRQVLGDIRSGAFARAWMAEWEAGGANFEAARARNRAHDIEEAGRRVRALLPWLSKPDQSGA